MKLFHITKTHNIPTILTRGLVPNYTKGLTSIKSKQVQGVIWLTDDVQFIIDTQCGNEWMRDATILEIDVVGLTIHARCAFPRGIIVVMPHEFVYAGSIPAQRISVQGS